jgi:hypothetical protein
MQTSETGGGVAARYISTPRYLSGIRSAHVLNPGESDYR